MRSALVLVPGIQGRWEYSQKAIDALSADFDVIVFPMCGERGCLVTDAGADIDAYAQLIAQALDARGLDRAIVCCSTYSTAAWRRCRL